MIEKDLSHMRGDARKAYELRLDKLVVVRIIKQYNLPIPNAIRAWKEMQPLFKDR